MGKIHQVIVRNVPEKGLDVVATDLLKSQIQNISLFLPEEELSDFNKVFLTKFHHSSGNVVLRFTFDDGTDRFGRQSIKTHSLIINNAFYNEKTLQYFISPLINGSMNIDDDRILEKNDFEMLETHPISSKFTEIILCKKRIQLTSQKEIDPTVLIQLFGSFDRLIPPPLNPSFSFQTMVFPGHKNTIKTHDLIFSIEKLPHSQSIEKIQTEKSEFTTIQAITDSISDLPLLRQLQRQLFLEIPERWLRIKIQWRFGVKKFSDIRENINNYFT
ncbi:MAG: hypothetical protein JSW11_12220 [Candidatus Heimdallarchaeota archaeon]|nr:MAG: hypothetical protein JSW11_12220 [Candidatus Heimdallarchaeota archaeon]